MILMKMSVVELLSLERVASCNLKLLTSLAILCSCRFLFSSDLTLISDVSIPYMLELCVSLLVRFCLVCPMSLPLMLQSVGQSVVWE